MANALDTLTSGYRDEIADNKRTAEMIAENVITEKREPTESEQSSLDRLYERNDDLNKLIAKTARDYGLAQDTSDRLALLGAARGADIEYRSAGELLWDMLHSHGDEDARLRYTRFQRAVDSSRSSVRLTRAAEHLGLDKANTAATAGGFNGLVVIPQVGAVLDPSPTGAPLFSALNPTPVTSATFQRPRIVDPNFATGVGVPTGEKEEGASKTWDIVAEPLTLDVVRGYINVSELLLEMISGSLDMVVSHMNRRLEWALETAAVTAVASGASSTALAAAADAGAVQAAIAAAAVKVFTATKSWPSWIAMGPGAAGRLMALTDAADRPLFPWIGPANALGAGGFGGPVTSVAGLTPVLTPGITDFAMYVGNADSIEAYLRRFPLMQALEPALWGRQIGVAAAVQFYHPITTEAGPLREGVAKIAWAAS